MTKSTMTERITEYLQISILRIIKFHSSESVEIYNWEVKLNKQKSLFKLKTVLTSHVSVLRRQRQEDSC